MSYSDGVAENVMGLASAARALAAFSALGLGATPMPVILELPGGGVRLLGAGGGVLALGAMAPGRRGCDCWDCGAFALAAGAGPPDGAAVADAPLVGSLEDGGFFAATMTMMTL